MTRADSTLDSQDLADWAEWLYKAQEEREI